jgi:hypothetical protein
MPGMFNERQHAAVRAAFALCGYFGELRTLPLDAGDAICLILGEEDWLGIVETHDAHDLDLVLEGILGQKVFVLADIGNQTVPFA